MPSEVENVCVQLDHITASISSSGENRTFAEAYGWNAAPLTKLEVASRFSTLSAKLRAQQAAGISPELATQIPTMEARLSTFVAINLPQLLSGNAQGVMGPLALLIDWLEAIITPPFDWESVPTDALPKKIKNRISSANSRLALLEPDLESLSAKIAVIRDAHDTALALPTDLQELQEANEKLASVSADSTQAAAEINLKREEALKLVQLMEQSRTDAEKIIEQAQQAYAAATSRGLAAAFDERAGKLTNSMWVCIGGLVAALGLGSYIGATRVTALTRALEAKAGVGEILVEFLISLLSIGAPLWFSWLMTKQIGQRFRLSEDYAFKASVAKAYEGFRREAVRIDPEFEKRLFASALTRLEEPPLRLVEQATHGSPYQEFVNSPAVQKALQVAPDFKEQVLGLARQAVERARPPRTANTDQ